MAWPVPCTQRLNHGCHLFRLVPDHDDCLLRFGRRTNAHNVLDESAPTGAMKHFGEARFQPRALPCGENHNGEIVGSHK
jgi:hypothetical protein